MRTLRVVTLGLAVVSSYAMAREPLVPQSSQSRASHDGTEEIVNTATNEKVICRRDKTIGSRLKAERICLTREQWAVRLREERTKLEQGQAQRTLTDHSDPYASN